MEIEKAEHRHIEGDLVDHDEPVIETAQTDTAYWGLTPWQTAKLFRKVVFISTGVFMGALFDGFAISIPGGMAANAEFIQRFGTVVVGGVKQLDANYVAAWGGITSGGQIVGMIIGGFTSDRFGRKFNMYMLTGALIIANILNLTATEWIGFLLARFFAGLGTGLIQTSLTTYISEIAPTNLRGALLAIYSVWFAVGQFAATVALQVVSSNATPYKNAFYSEFFFLGLFLPFLFYCPESPWFHARRGQDEKAKKSLLFLNGGIPGYNVDTEYAVLRAEVDHHLELHAQSSQHSWIQLFRGVNRRRTWVSFLPLACQQLVGIPIVFGYLSYFFSIAGVADPFLPSVIVNVLLITFVIVASFTVEKFGRRFLLLTGTIIMMACTLGMGIIGTISGDGPLKASQALVALACIWVVAYAMSLGPLGWAYVADSSTPQLRAKTTSFAAAGTACFGLIFNYTTPLMLSPQRANWGIKTGYFFACASVIGLVLMYFTVPETRGRTFAQLDELFERRISARKFATTKTQAEEGQAPSV